jgi:hypothetical protein
MGTVDKDPLIPVKEGSSGTLVGGFRRRFGFGGRLALEGPAIPPEGVEC